MSEGMPQNSQDTVAEQQQPMPSTEKNPGAMTEVVKTLHAAAERPEFPGAAIFNQGDGKFYAVTQQPSGELMASEFTLTPEGSVGATYQVHDTERFEPLMAQQEQERSLRAETETSLKINALYQMAGQFDSFTGQYPEGSKKSVQDIRIAVESLDPEAQTRLAQKFFDATITAKNDTAKAYQVYGALKGTTFASVFKDLENTRLVAAGYGNFNL